MSSETDALIPKESSEEPNGSKPSVPKHLKTVLFATVLCSLSIAFQLEMHSINLALADQNEHIATLETTVAKQKVVIDRFNSSITNTDVLGRLEALEANLTATRQSLQDELDHEELAVKQQLDSTLKELSNTVNKAENEIQDEVTKVKADVESYVRSTQDQFSMENSFMVYQLAGTFTVLTCLISMWHMTAHLRKFNQPTVQRKIMAILWMSPLYAVTSWFSLVFHSAEGYLAIVKDAYEAYIIYQFLSFCIAVLGKGDRDNVVDLLSRRADHLTPPFRFCAICEACGLVRPYEYEDDRHLADAILLQCQAFAIQFVFLRPVITTAMVVLNKLQYYGLGDGPGDYKSPQFSLTVLQNLSIAIAFAGLLKFYHAVDKDLAWCRPFPKFLCIKGVVFMTFWQGLALSVLAEFTDVSGEGDRDEWAKSAQNFLICLEMLLFSIAHFYCFPTDEWQDDYRLKHSNSKFGDSLALRDFASDLSLILRSNKRKKRRKPGESIAEGDETVTSNGTSLHTGSSDSIPDDHQIARALEECLGEASDDPEVVEAARRLAGSNVLSPDMFEDPGQTDKVDNMIDDFIAGDEEKVSSSLVKQYSSAMENDDEESPYDSSGGIYSTKSYHEDGADPNEATKLLTPGKKQNLRPSIFTTVATLAQESEEGKDEDKKSS